MFFICVDDGLRFFGNKNLGGILVSFFFIKNCIIFVVLIEIGSLDFLWVIGVFEVEVFVIFIFFINEVGLRF